MEESIIPIGTQLLVADSHKQKKRKKEKSEANDIKKLVTLASHILHHSAKFSGSLLTGGVWSPLVIR